MINGTTLCIHCKTRFRVSKAQLAAHQGMVRCGHCLQAFDARPNFIADTVDAQPADIVETELVSDIDQTDPVTENLQELSDIPTPEKAGKSKLASSVSHLMSTTAALFASRENNSDAAPGNGSVDRSWIWVSGVSILTILLLAQSAYFFRISLAAHMPALKPTLQAYCRLLNCSVPLPENLDLISMESSSLDADPVKANQITLNALLRNRAKYPLAYPLLALTLNDSQDKPLSRRTFLPSEYLPDDQSELIGLQRNQELNIKLRLRVLNLKPSGYRLELFYKPKE
jgi:predicted Zn finger-like uncharacterized protein